MPPTEELPQSKAETPDTLRRRAARARRLAENLHPNDEGRQRLLQFAADLDAQAADLDQARSNGQTSAPHEFDH